MKPLLAIILAALPFATGAAGVAPPVIGGLTRPEKTTPRISGAVLLSELSCAACHATARPDLAAKPGPDLSAVGARAHGAHLREFIAKLPLPEADLQRLLAMTPASYIGKAAELAKRI